ncbi:Macrophage erythroblast attacher isoform 1 [Mycena indigotica]|uniref:Macrophage erythroblast attacher isoform 1 n=1 Tax=Mycena indigotica TaxID=2126181 RepID=A0A8H6VSU5_9AGAR|nr:Macrophage erythroblast attacher isoform 1 [Mycena indigotica]KAF7290686.1 Macrophage erythroblast attacher isoform 1 [Mycena indigotica]
MSTSQMHHHSSPLVVAQPRSLRPMMLPSLTISPISDLDVEDFPGQFARRGSEDSGDDSEAAREKQRLDTAARRASHNAVERQRRDRLNARILELSTLLPNLAGVRRPSRIAITKSSIAYIHNSRKQRILASQQLRMLHSETEALRAEVNQWRQRAGVPPAAEPRRGDGFMLVLSGAELEIEPVDTCEDEEYDNAMLGYPPVQGRSMPYPPSYNYGGSPPSSAGFPPSPYYPSPPSSASFAPSPSCKYDVNAPVALAEPRIACPTPSNPYDSPQYMLQTEEEWAAMYGGAPRAPQDGSW